MCRAILVSLLDSPAICTPPDAGETAPALAHSRELAAESPCAPAGCLAWLSRPPRLPSTAQGESQVCTRPVRATLQMQPSHTHAAGLLRLPADVLVLPWLSCRSLGALMFTCKQLRACVRGAQLTACIADAGRVLSKAHPLFSSTAVGTFLAEQAALAAALSAPETWKLADSTSPAAKHISFAPDMRHAAAANSSVLLLYDCSGEPPTAVQLPAPSLLPLCNPWLRCT